MQTLPVGKYQNHVHGSQTETPEKLKERVQFMARVVNVIFASISVQLGLLGRVCQGKVCGPRDTNG